jgi:hypothetical protein
MASGRRQRVWALELPGAGSVVVKVGGREAIAREVAALERLGGRGPAPALVAHDEGLLVTAHVAGETGPLSRASSDALNVLGTVLSRLHSLESAAEASYPGWREPARSLQ